MKAWAVPVAYIRRSVASRADPGDLSREFQTEKVRALAGADADRLKIVDQDWGRSAATDKTDRRLAFLSLLADIEAGEVSALYAYSADRLARSVEWSARLLNACRRAGVTIVTSEGRFAPEDDAATDLFNFRAVVNESALRQMEKKARAAIERRRARNLAAGLDETAGMGRKPYGALPGERRDEVIAAFLEAGSFAGAAKLLNADAGREVRTVAGRLIGTGRGVPARGGRPWDTSSVRLIVRHDRPDLLPVGGPGRGSRPRGTHLFTRLLRCWCGSTLTSVPDRDLDTVRYLCVRARDDQTHSRPYVVAERKVRAWAEEETRRLSPVFRALFADPPDPAAVGRAHAALDAKRARVIDTYTEGLIDKAERDRRLAAIDRDREAIETRGRLAGVALDPKVDWSKPPAEVNAKLRLLWEAIALGPDMLPVRAIWRPTERYGEDGPAPRALRPA